MNGIEEMNIIAIRNGRESLEDMQIPYCQASDVALRSLFLLGAAPLDGRVHAVDRLGKMPESPHPGAAPSAGSG